MSNSTTANMRYGSFSTSFYLEYKNIKKIFAGPGNFWDKKCCFAAHSDDEMLWCKYLENYKSFNPRALQSDLS